MSFCLLLMRHIFKKLSFNMTLAEGAHVLPNSHRCQKDLGFRLLEVHRFHSFMSECLPGLA